jgi:cytochrome b subunit of formate dehydrogenase
MSELKFKRFTLNQRIQHIIFFMSFILLAYTGFPLKFPDEWWSRWMIASVGGFDNRTLIHHISGFAMIGISIYHVVFHAILEKPRYDILFNLKDVQDFWQQMLYFLKISNDHPKFGRYTWKQKFEYFGGGFGAVIMGFTGILMLNPFESMKYFPLGLIQIAGLFHTWEAVLASIAVFIGHFYDEHFGKFPNLSWLTGNVSEEEMEHEHQLEYEASIDDYNAKNVIKKTGDNATKSHYDVRNRLIIVFSKTVFTVIFLIVCIWMLWISYHTLLEAVETYIL